MKKDISSLKVRYVCKETGSLADEMPDNKGNADYAMRRNR